MTILRAQNLTIQIDSRILIEDFSYNFSSGTLYAITGPNGCGKTSLLGCLSGIIKPISGNVSRLAVASLSQLDVATPHITVLNRISHGLYNSNQPNKLIDDDMIRQVENIATKLGLLHLLNKPLYALSAGEQRRVSIARTLINESADAYLLDEPFAGVDAANQQLLIKHFADLAKTKIVIIALHEVELLRSHPHMNISLESSVAFKHAEVSKSCDIYR